MEAKSPTAEQQLLRVIEGQNGPEPKQEAAKGKAAGSSITDRRPPLFSLAVLRGRFSFSKEAFASLLKNSNTENTLDMVNNMLVVCVCGMFVFLGFEIMVRPKRFEGLPDLISMKRNVEAEAAQGQQLQEISFYMDKLKERGLFQPKPKEVKQETVVREVAKPTIDDKVQGIRLVGVSASKVKGESYAMIENVKTETTFFLREGESFSGLKVTDILPDRVIFTDGESTAEVR